MSRPATGLHARLRAATGAEHQALEDALDWRARVATLDGYRALLARFHGFHAVWEAAIAERLADEPFLAPRRRLAHLAADLAHLGLPAAAIGALPRPDPIPLHGEAGALGALYVLEGSTLGGQVVGRHIAGLHGLSEGGLAYYRGHGPRTGAMWGAFRDRLDGFPGDGATVAAAAVATFTAMRVWLCDGAVRDGAPSAGREIRPTP